MGGGVVSQCRYIIQLYRLAVRSDLYRKVADFSPLDHKCLRFDSQQGFLMFFLRIRDMYTHDGISWLYEYWATRNVKQILKSRRQHCKTIYTLICERVYLYYTFSYTVFRMAHSEPSSGVKGKAIYNKNLSN